MSRLPKVGDRVEAILGYHNITKGQQYVVTKVNLEGGILWVTDDSDHQDWFPTPHFKLVSKTLEDLVEGDVVVNKAGNKRTVLGRVGKVIFLSYSDQYSSDGCETYCSGYTIRDLQEGDYTIDQPIEEQTETIKIFERKLSKKDFEDALWNLKEVI